MDKIAHTKKTVVEIAMEDHRFTLLADQHSVDAAVDGIHAVEDRLWIETLVGMSTGKRLIAFGTWKAHSQGRYYLVPQEIMPEISTELLPGSLPSKVICNGN